MMISVQSKTPQFDKTLKENLKYREAEVALLAKGR